MPATAADQDEEQLRQLVEVQLAQQPAEHRDPVLDEVRHREPARQLEPA
jgi:hypothetical protein